MRPAHQHHDLSGRHPTAASSPTASKIFDTSASTGMGYMLVGAAHPTGWWVNVPANSYAGTYTSTITWQLTSAP